MTRPLDPRFAVVIASMAGAGWIARELAREEAERIARASGFTFAEALRAIGRGPTPAASASPGPAHFRLSALPPDEAQHLSTDAPAPDREPFAKLPADVGQAIAVALAADPCRTDRDIARELRCSPTTVGRARAAARLVCDVRAVRRRGQAYGMRVASH